MKLTMAKAIQVRTAPEPASAWDPGTDPAVASLLDHLAEELAIEYVRLMEAAARHDDGSDCAPQPQEG